MGVLIEGDELQMAGNHRKKWENNTKGLRNTLLYSQERKDTDTYV